jgi:hypothetical protein
MDIGHEVAPLRALRRTAGFEEHAAAPQGSAFQSLQRCLIGSITERLKSHLGEGDHESDGFDRARMP